MQKVQTCWSKGPRVRMINEEPDEELKEVEETKPNQGFSEG
jgi:hypothetical protein